MLAVNSVYVESLCGMALTTAFVAWKTLKVIWKAAKGRTQMNMSDKAKR